MQIQRFIQKIGGKMRLLIIMVNWIAILTAPIWGCIFIWSMLILDIVTDFNTKDFLTGKISIWD